MAAHQAWNVYLNGKRIDTVFFVPHLNADYVRRALIGHDGYNQAIAVRRDNQVSRMLTSAEGAELASSAAELRTIAPEPLRRVVGRSSMQPVESSSRHRARRVVAS
jgi:hypothetical protein